MQFHYLSPLKWPSGYAVTAPQARHYGSQFKSNLTIDEAIGLLEEEMAALGIVKATMYSDYEQIKVERLRRKQGANPGVYLEFRLGDCEYTVACDRWSQTEQNIYALHLVLRSYRLMEKWGVAPLPKLMQGFVDQRKTHVAASHTNGQEDWMTVLGLGPTATLEDAHAVYRRRAKLVANDQQELIVLNNAMDEARKKLVP